jgi:DNA mismatch repair ATPase MutS
MHLHAGFQANDTFISEQCCLHIITGPTMAGKSTYLKQVRWNPCYADQ